MQKIDQITSTHSSRLFRNLVPRGRDPFGQRRGSGPGVPIFPAHDKGTPGDVVGFFVYQYAKLRMLQFYYDFLDKYLDRADFQMCEMDTDSAYIAISGESVESLVKPELKAEFEQDKCN